MNDDDTAPAISGTKLIDVTATVKHVETALNRLATRWTQTHTEAMARLTIEMTGVITNNLNSVNYPNGPLSFQRVQECHYNPDARESKGIISVYVPNRKLHGNRHQFRMLCY